MAQSKEFLNESHKLYYDVAKGMQLMTLANFGEVYALLPNSTTMMSNRDAVGKSLLKNLKNLGFTDFSDRDLQQFVETPLNLKKRTFPGSELERAFDDTKDVQAIINELFGHYSVAVKIIDFLVERDHNNFNKNQTLLKEVASLQTKLATIESKALVDPNMVGKLTLHNKNPLALDEKERTNVEKVESKDLDDEDLESAEDAEKPEDELSPFI